MLSDPAPQLVPLTPEQLHDAFIAAGYVVIEETASSWSFAWTKNGDDVPFPVGKRGSLVPIRNLDSLIHHPHATGALRKAIVDACTAVGAAAAARQVPPPRPSSENPPPADGGA